MTKQELQKMLDNADAIDFQGQCFDCKAYIHSEGLKVVFLLKREEIERYQQYISKDFYNILRGLSK